MFETGVPAGLSEGQYAAAAAAQEAYVAAWELSDRAYADPGDDWVDAVYQVMADPRAFMFMESLSRLQAAGFRLQGQTTVYTRVTEVIGDGQPGTVVHLVVCLDGDDLVLVDASGAPVENVADLPSRTMSTGVVARYEDRDGGWLVRSMTPTPVAFEEC